jgi:hypothetical protein
MQSTKGRENREETSVLSIAVGCVFEEPKITLGVMLEEPLHGGEILRGQHVRQVVEAERASVGDELSPDDVGQYCRSG